ncbi:MAG: hypothetical protein M4D80_04295 [Myxococcota bacterium]|nr:hypothetical protein [Myxococcota bacterium]
MADDALLDRLAKLEAMNEQLLQRVVELGIEVQRTRTGGFRSMRDARRCPACGEGSIVHVRRAQVPAAEGLTELGLTYTHSQWRGATKPVGAMESYGCRSCGLVEFHVVDWKSVTADGKDIIAIDPEGEPPKGGPFR